MVREKDRSLLDPAARQLIEPFLRQAARWIDQPWVSPERITIVGLVLGLGSATAAGLQIWIAALVLWLLSRLADGLDGPLARRRAGAGHADAGTGGFLDISADFGVYGAFVLGVAFGTSQAHGTSLWPFLFVLVAYYVNGATLLAFSSIAERTSRQIDDDRSLSFMPGWAGGTETILVHSLWLAFPQFAGQLALFWALVVGINAIRQIVVGYRRLS